MSDAGRGVAAGHPLTDRVCIEQGCSNGANFMHFELQTRHMEVLEVDAHMGTGVCIL